MAAQNNVPLVLAAVVCERVLEEKDGVLSATRIVDRFFLERRDDLPAGAVLGIQFHYLVVLKRGAAAIAPGRHEASLVLRSPSGQQSNLTQTPFEMRWPSGDAEDDGVNLNIRLQIGLTEEGLYWIDLLFDGSLAVSTPLRVIFGLPS